VANRGRDIGVGVGIFVVSIVAAGGVGFGVEALADDDDDATPAAAAPDVFDTTSTTGSAEGDAPTEDGSTPTTSEGAPTSEGTPTTTPRATTGTAGSDAAGSETVELLVSDAQGADSCEELADTTIEFIQALIVEAEGLSLADLESLGGAEPGFIADYEPAGTAVDERIAELDCGEAEFSALVCDRGGQLTTTNAFGDSFRSSFVDESCGA
jgi:hypothetical protein